MNDFNGLGIVIEEKDPNGEASYLDNNNLENPNTPRSNKRISSTENEILLPPLPHGEIDLNRTPSLTNSNTDDVNTVELLNSGDIEVSRRNSDFSDFLSKQNDYSNYELDSPNLKIDSKFQVFPTLNKSYHQNTETNSTHSGVNASNGNISTNNTSPLKRLKSLKNGIRKLSLTSLSGSRSSSNIMLIKQETIAQNEPRSSESSNRLSLSNVDSFSVNSNSAQHTSTGVETKKRTRTYSYPIVNTPLTPPVSSPVVTVSENLSAAKKSLYSSEQSYFESINLRPSISAANSFDSDMFENDQLKNADTNSLVNYLRFLKQQKKTVIDAYELTKSKLADSGWCSAHDLNNIQLQQDTSLCQIDTKLSQIKEELFKETNSEESPNSKSSTSNEKDDPLQSLKVLESKYLVIAESQKNL